MFLHSHFFFSTCRYLDTLASRIALIFINFIIFNCALALESKQFDEKESNKTPSEIPPPLQTNVRWNQGWQSLISPEPQRFPKMDALSVEWDYFQIHAGNQFVVIGLVLNNPRAVISDKPTLLPTGLNLSIVTEGPNIPKFNKFLNFPLSQTKLNLTSADVQASIDGTENQVVLSTKPGSETHHLFINTSEFEINLFISPRSFPLPPKFANDVGYLTGEKWTVDMVGLKSYYTGYIMDKRFQIETKISDYGYRERSFGQYAILPDGWDFHVATFLQPGEATPASFALQTYNKSKILDYVEWIFSDNQKTVHERFDADKSEVDLTNSNWTWSTLTQQCIPRSGFLLMKNAHYTIELAFESFEKNDVPLLSNITKIVDKFGILYRFPKYVGTIRRADGQLVSHISGDGIAEFAFAKALTSEKRTREDCEIWGEKFSKLFFIAPKKDLTLMQQTT